LGVEAVRRHKSLAEIIGFADKSSPFSHAPASPRARAGRRAGRADWGWSRIVGGAASQEGRVGIGRMPSEDAGYGRADLN